MAFRVGIDLAAAEPVREALAAHGERYLQRVYTPAEQADCHGDPVRLAARFAAKEAALKALRAGDAAVPLTDIEVLRARDGAPSLALHGAAAELARELGVRDAQVSLTHEADQAAAVVLIELPDRPGQDQGPDTR